MDASQCFSPFQGSIDRHANLRLRRLLIEVVRLLWKLNPTYCRLQRWSQKTDTEKLSRARLKELAVATARQSAVDWGRWRTGRISAEERGLRKSYQGLKDRAEPAFGPVRT